MKLALDKAFFCIVFINVVVLVAGKCLIWFYVPYLIVFVEAVLAE